MRKNRGLIGLLIIFIIIFLGALAMTVRALLPYLEAGREYKKLEESYVQEVPEKQQNKVAESSQTQELCPIAVNWKELKETNPDIVGWIYGEDTKINYPVVHGKDNTFYLTHMADRSKNSSGSIFMDCRNTERSEFSNEILYGHHMKNGSMFAELQKYKSQEYYEAHSCFYYLTETGNYRLEILRAGIITGDSELYHLAFESQEEREAYVKRWDGKSKIVPVFSEKNDTPLMTLSTCSYETKNARFVVQGQLIRMD